MNRLLKTFTAAALVFTATNVLASPQKLITHNLTNFDSNAFVAGSIPSRHPTKAHSEGKVSWTEVRMACFGHLVGNKCSADIYMYMPTQILIGTVAMDVDSGEITPGQLHANGFTVTVNGPGETTITKD